MDYRCELFGVQLLAGALVSILITGCAPVVLNKPNAVAVGQTPQNPTEPVYEIDFTFRYSYESNTLRVDLNGQDITQRYTSLATDDFKGVADRYVQTLHWTASCIPGTAFCTNADFTYTFRAWGLGFTCAPQGFDQSSRTNLPTPPTSYATTLLPHPNCMDPSHSLRLSPTTGTSGTVTIELAPAGGLTVQLIPDSDPKKAWLSINGGAVSAPATLSIPMSAQRQSFNVALLPANLPAGFIQAQKLYTSIALKAKGFAPTTVPVSIAP
jgi:hypothetical protein